MKRPQFRPASFANTGLADMASKLRSSIPEIKKAIEQLKDVKKKLEEEAVRRGIPRTDLDQRQS